MSESFHEVCAAIDLLRVAKFGTQRITFLKSLRDANSVDRDEACEAFKTGNHAVLANLAHRIKGAVRLVGGEALIDACIDMEAACVADDPIELRDAFEAFRLAIDRFQSDIDGCIAAGDDA